MKKAITTTILGSMFSIYYLVMYILSYESYNDGWGTDKSFNLDYLIAFICFLVLVCAGGMIIYNKKKDKEYSEKKVYINVILLISMIIIFYNFGLMFKNIAKGKNADVILPYMYFGIFGLYLLYLFVINKINKVNKITSVIGLILAFFPLVLFFIYLGSDIFLSLDYLFLFILASYFMGIILIINYNNNINLLDKKKVRTSVLVFIFACIFVAMIYSFKEKNIVTKNDWYYDELNLSSLKSKDTVVAIIDSGYKVNSGFNEDKIILKYNVFDDSNDVLDEYGHGTSLLSLLIGYDDGNNKIKGINPDAFVIVVKAMDNYGKIAINNLEKAVYFAVNNGAKIINLSIGTNIDNDNIHKAIRYANDNDVYVIASVGDNLDNNILYPANYKEVISVEAQSKTGERYVLSNISSSTNVRIPGVDIKVFGYDIINNEWKVSKESGSSISTIIFTSILSTYDLSNNPLNFNYFNECISKNEFLDVKMMWW